MRVTLFADAPNLQPEKRCEGTVSIRISNKKQTCTIKFVLANAYDSEKVQLTMSSDDCDYTFSHKQGYEGLEHALRKETNKNREDLSWMLFVIIRELTNKLCKENDERDPYRDFERILTGIGSFILTGVTHRYTTQDIGWLIFLMRMMSPVIDVTFKSQNNAS